MATFEQIMTSQPSVFQNSTLATLMSSAQTLGSAWSLYQSVSNLTRSWGGPAQTAQAGQATSLLSSSQQVMTALGQTQAMIKGGSTQMSAAKTRLTALVAAAKAEGFIVMPTGTVMLGPSQIAAMSAHPGLAAYYHARQAMYTGQINAVVFQSTASDIQVGLSLAKTGVDIITALTQKSQSAPPPSTATLPPATAAPIAGFTPTIGNPLTGDQSTVGSGSTLAGLGDLGGAPIIGGTGGLSLTGAGASPGLPGGLGGAPGLGGGGTAALGGATALGGASGVRAGAGGAGTTMIGAAGGGRGAAGGAGTGGRSVGSSSGSMLAGTGGYGAGQSDEEREARGWLVTEDQDTFRPDLPDTTADGVLSS